MVGALVALLVLAVVIQSVAFNPRWEWGVFARWFFDPVILEGLGQTLLLTLLGTVLSVIFGGSLALARLSSSWLLSSPRLGHIWLFRSLPLIVVLIILYNFSYLYDTLSLGIPFTGVTWASYQTINVLGQFSTAVVGLTLVQSAHTAEIIRGGFSALTTGSMKPPPRWGYRLAAHAAHYSAAGAAHHLALRLQRDHQSGQGNGDGVRPGDAGTVLHHPDDLQPYPGGDPAVDGRRRLVSGDHQRPLRHSVSGGTGPGAQRAPLGGKQRPQQPSGINPHVNHSRRRPFMPSSHMAISLSPGSAIPWPPQGAGRCVAGDPPGTVTVILGPSGSGKSTLLRTINHLERVDEGFIQIDGDYIGYRRKGDKLYEMKEKEILRQRINVGYVFQNFNLFPHLTVLENLIEAPIAHQQVTRKEAIAVPMNCWTSSDCA